MKKSKFKLGDIVVHKIFRNGVGKVIQIQVRRHKKEYRVVVKWQKPPWHTPLHRCIHSPVELKLVETPIERMKRRYEEA